MKQMAPDLVPICRASLRQCDKNFDLYIEAEEEAGAGCRQELGEEVGKGSIEGLGEKDRVCIVGDGGDGAANM